MPMPMRDADPWGLCVAAAVSVFCEPRSASRAARGLCGYRVDIDGGADVEPPGRVPIVGPAGPLAVLCGVLGGAVVGLGAEVGCGLPPVAGAVGFVADFAGAE